jgi:hypothetical protein
MSGQTASDHDTLHAALYVACRAPSLHNSQPWRWQLAAHSVHLRADPTRILPATDPTGRQMVISCGAALHHARVAFAALGWNAIIHRLPNPTDPGHLASIEFDHNNPIRARDVTLAAAAVRRRTDRRPFLPSDLPEPTMSRLASVAHTEGAELLILPPMMMPELLMTSWSLDSTHHTNTGYRAQPSWIATPNSTTLLTPVAAQRVHMARDFQTSGGTFTAPPHTPDGATLTVLHTADDDRCSWLQTGEALAAVLLEATAAGLATGTLTHPTEIKDTRAALEQAITSLSAHSGHAHSGHAQALIRIGHVPSPLPGPRTPRRPHTDVLEQLP